METPANRGKAYQDEYIYAKSQATLHTFHFSQTDPFPLPKRTYSPRIPTTTAASSEGEVDLNHAAIAFQGTTNARGTRRVGG